MICLFVCLFIWTMIVSSTYVVCWDLRTLRIKCFKHVLILFPGLLSHIWINMFHISDNTSSYVTRSLGCHLTSRKPLRLVVPPPKFLLRTAGLVLSIRSGRLHLAFATGPDPAPAKSKPGTTWWKTRGRASAGSIRCTQPGSPAAVAGGSSRSQRGCQLRERMRLDQMYCMQAAGTVSGQGEHGGAWKSGDARSHRAPKRESQTWLREPRDLGSPKGRSSSFSSHKRGKQGRVFQPCLWLQLF